MEKLVLRLVEGIPILNTHESIRGAVGKRPVFHRLESKPEARSLQRRTTLKVH